jgi:two-component system, cell cycle sensor histidine kinase and response regulator CckA
LNSPTSLGPASQNATMECAESARLETQIAGAFPPIDGWGGPETILLVEDEALVRRVAAEVLESAGYTLLIAESASQALQACRNRFAPVDLLLADVVMPGMNGRDLAAEFASFYPQAKVMLMSGYPEQLAPGLPSTCGNTHLAKPFSVTVLLQRVRQLLDTKPHEPS